MMEKQNIEKIGWDLVARFLAGEATQEEQSRVESWINESDSNKKELEEIKKIMEETGQYYQLKRFHEDDALDAIRTKIQETSPSREKSPVIGKRKVYTLFRYAAIGLLAVALGISGYYFGFRGEAHPSIQLVASLNTDIPKEVILPDGSVVTLNSNSEISYPSRFRKKIREVEIAGEAFFNVTPDPNRPFVITAGETQIKVLGTSFNVSAYPGSETVEVVVETGKVQVMQKVKDHKNSAFVMLDPGQMASFSVKDKKLVKKTNDDPNYIAWKTKSLVFEKARLSYVIENLKKTYNVEIETNGLDDNELVLTAQFNNKPIDFVLDVIRLTFNLELSEENGRYTLKSPNL